jgi:hypothetical protein
MQSQHNGHRSDLNGGEELLEAARSGQHRQESIQEPVQEPVQEPAAPDEEIAAEGTTDPSEPPADEQRRPDRERMERELGGE